MLGHSRLHTPVLREARLREEPGRHAALAEANGSRKSTLGRVIAGLETPWAGQVLVDFKTTLVLLRLLKAPGAKRRKPGFQDHSGPIEARN